MMQVRDHDIHAHDVFAKAWGVTMPERPIQVTSMLCFMAVARLESFYGLGWHGAMAGSWNFGALQSTRPRLPDGSAPPGTSLATDTHPTSSGANVAYVQPFKRYATEQDGCNDLMAWFARHQAVYDASTTGIALVFSTAMHDAHYYEGTGPNDDIRIHRHAAAVYGNAKAIVSSTGMPFAMVWGEMVPPDGTDDGAAAAT